MIQVEVDEKQVLERLAIKQETFLDDFEVPNPLPDEDEEK